MPRAAPKICSYSGCNTLTLSNKCNKHKNIREYDKHRKNSYQRGYTRKWSKARLEFLSMNPLCVYCHKENIMRTATVVDHKIPHKGDMELFWDETNWQALCKTCHDVKTATEDGGFGQEGKKRIKTGNKKDGLPLNKQHHWNEDNGNE